MGVEIDTPVASFAVQALQKLKGGGPTKEQMESVKVLLDSITSSKAWPRFMEVLKKTNVRNMWPVAEVFRANQYPTAPPPYRARTCYIAYFQLEFFRSCF